MRYINLRLTYLLTRLTYLSWGAATVQGHSFHDTPPGGTIGRTPTCCMDAKVEWLEISYDCS